jgi:hypothetical protein
MQAHRVYVTIPEDHKVMIDVPAEVPTGDAEVIVLSSASVGAPQPADTTFAARFRPNPAKALFPNGLDAELRPIGPSQVAAAVVLRERLDIRGPDAPREPIPLLTMTVDVLSWFER